MLLRKEFGIHSWNFPTPMQHKHHIKSFVLRQGKITSGQLNAINKFMPVFGIGFQPQMLDLSAAFDNSNQVIIEIGFGMGTATWQIAQKNPENNYLGIEVHGPGVGTLLMAMVQNNVTNLRIIQHDAVEVLRDMIPDNSIAGFHIYFPDPWPKKKHNKRRIIQADFVNLLCTKLQIGGYIHLATDCQDYALWIMSTLTNNLRLKNQSLNNAFVERPEFRPLTKFEQRGLGLGHGIKDLMFKRV